MRTRSSLLRWMTATAAFAAAAVLAAAAGANSGTFTDPAGDAGGAPDITTVAVNDSASGLLQFSATVTGLSVNTPTTFGLLLDTDRNVATGMTGGFEYAVFLMHDADGGVYSLMHWTGTTLQNLNSPSLALSVSGDAYTFSIAKAELGSPTSFNWGVLAAATDSQGNITAMDRAPDGGNWIYELSAATPPTVVVQPVIGVPATVPAKPKAGKQFTVSFPVTRSDNGAPLTTGTMICDPSVNGKVITHRESFVNGNARLAFTIPKTAKSKTLKVQVTIKVGGKSAHRVVTYHVS